MSQTSMFPVEPQVVRDEYNNMIEFIETIVDDELVVKINGRLTGFYHKDTSTYFKHEKEKDVYRKLNAWSIPLQMLNYFQTLVVESEEATYKIEATNIDRSEARTHTNKEGIKETKIYIPKHKFDEVVFKDDLKNKQLAQLGKSWYFVLEKELNSTAMHTIQSRLKQDIQKGYTIFPKKEDIFKAFRLTPLENVKVVILGQDPYPHSHANGLAFSSLEQTAPASLKNIFKELEEDLGTMTLISNNNLERWAKQGVFLLNTVLTVQGGYANSHKGIGWEEITGAAVRALSEASQPMVWVLWGNQAANVYKKYKKPNSSPTSQLVITSPHPSPLSANGGFFGSKPFTRVNEFLVRNNVQPIDWLKGNEDVWKNT